MSTVILEPQTEYTFSHFYNLPNLVEEIVNEFGYTSSFARLMLPSRPIDVAHAEQLKEQYFKVLPHINLTSEAARREFYISPLLHELLHNIVVKIHLEQPLIVAGRLRGTLDYLLRAEQELMIIEAKKGDIEAGFNQLAVQLIALNETEKAYPSRLYGAVSSGTTWRFGVLERENKHLVQDLNTYNLPRDTVQLVSILSGILSDRSA